MKALLKFWVWTIFGVLPAYCVACLVYTGITDEMHRRAVVEADVDISMMPLPCVKAPKDPTCVGPYKRGS